MSRFSSSLSTARSPLHLIAAILTVCCISFSTLAGDKIVKDFNLKNTDGKIVSLSSYPDAKGFIIVFTCNHCPFAKLYPERMNELAETYGPKQVPLLAIRSTDTLTFEDDTWPNMVKKVADEHWNYPYLADDNQAVARDFQAQKTPHAYVVWNDNGKWVVKYSGAIDDNGALPDMVKHHYVADAVEALLAGREVPVKQTKSIGCQIKLRQK